MPPSSISSNKLEGGDASPGAGTRFALEQQGWTEGVRELRTKGEAVTAQDRHEREYEPEPVHAVASPDELLQCGIGDYTYLYGSEGILGRGKFSTVYKVLGPTGEEYALKHTPLYPHHPLIAARLLREPTLLAQIPPHPCLVGVEGWVKSACHFYLVETLSRDHVPLSEVRTPISRRAAKKVLDQLVSVVRDGMHRGGRVCHRDLKAENVLIDGKGNLILLDLGLATHFSLSEPRLTTCCGSPAYHSPEIVDALARPPGSVSYYGPELDIWCIALTVLSLLVDRRYPIGTTHRSLDLMGQAVVECLAELDERFPLSFGDPASKYREEDVAEWAIVRRSLEAFLQIDGDARMVAFDEYVVGEAIDEEVRKHRMSMQGKAFKTVSFEKADIKYTLPVSLTSPRAGEEESARALQLSNPEDVPARKVVSYLKYLLRSAGILYHSLSAPEAQTTVLQCVLQLSPESPHIPQKRPVAVSNPSFLSTIFGNKGGAPAQPSSARRSHSTSRVGVAPSDRARVHCLRFFLTVTFGDGPGPAKQDALQLQQLGETVHAVKADRRRSLARTTSHDGRAGPPVDRFANVTKSQATVGEVSEMTRPKAARQASRSRVRLGTSHRQEGGQEPIWIRVSDARALEAVRSAIDQKHRPRSQPGTPAFEKLDPMTKRLERTLNKGESGISRGDYVDSPVQGMKDLEPGVEELHVPEEPVAETVVEAEPIPDRERGRSIRGRQSPIPERMDSPRSEASSAELRTPKVDSGDCVLVVEVDGQDSSTKPGRNKWLRGAWREDSVNRGGGHRGQSSSPRRMKAGMLMTN